jgi:hypothetical protein
VTWAVLLFVLSASLLLWPWAGYPALCVVLARLRRRPTTLTPSYAPLVTVIIAARDEASHLPFKLASLARGGIPFDRLEVILVDDGSTDETAALARAHGAKVISLPTPLGKAAALNVAVEAARGQVLVLTDARQPLCSGALARLVEPLADPTVGAVAGELDGAAVGAGGVYRRFDDALRRLESASGSSIGVAGALWACRRSLYPVLPAGLVLDDLYAPMVVIRTGHRVVVAPAARAVERAAATSPAVERRRRLRTLAGNLQLLAAAPWLLVPGINRAWLRFFSHKVARLLGPYALVGTAVSLVALATTGTFWLLLAALSALAVVFAIAGDNAGAPGRLARGFLDAQLLCALATWYALRGRAGALWRPQPPPGSPVAEAQNG